MPEQRADPITGDLTEPQREAVLYGDGPLLVVAGAGSGKTRIITRRIAHLAREGVPPDRMLAVTFTNKAADEMRRRVETMVGRDVLVTTFHSFCARLLRREIAALGMAPSFSIYDRGDSSRVVRQICKEMKLDPATYPPARLRERISLHKRRLETPEQSAREAVGIGEQTEAQVYVRYDERLRASNALDFDDLIARVIELFNARPDVLQQYQETYLHVLVDEYQDTNLPQHLIARALQGKHRNITAVGDPDQMIYTWRGARLENILEFDKDFPGAHVVTLERNYRSTANILRAASTCISFNQMRRDKVLWTDSEAGAPVRVMQFSDAYDEAERIAETVQELIEDGAEPNEIAVLYRTNYQSLPLEDSFAARTLPCQVVDTVRFFERRQVKDLCAYVQLLVNPDDDEAFLRVVNVPRRGIGAKTVEKLRQAARGAGGPLLRTARSESELVDLSPRARGALASFCKLYDRLASLQRKTVLSFLERLIKETGYLEAVPPEERDEAGEIVDYLLGYVKQYDRRHPGGDLVGFLEQTALISDVDGLNSGAQAVALMTLHSAKGLEFDVVFTIGVEEDILPHRRAVEERLYGTEEEALEEERRLFYVGMTRARHRLFITYADTHMARGRERSMLPSRFLEELPRDNIEWHRRPSGLPAASGGYGEQLEFILKRKRISLTILDGAAGDRLAPGVRVSHTQFGEGEIIEVTMLAQRLMIRVNFFGKGPMTILLAPEDVALADP